MVGLNVLIYGHIYGKCLNRESLHPISYISHSNILNISHIIWDMFSSPPCLVALNRSHVTWVLLLNHPEKIRGFLREVDSELTPSWSSENPPEVYPICSMYSIFAYMTGSFMVNLPAPWFAYSWDLIAEKRPGELVVLLAKGFLRSKFVCVTVLKKNRSNHFFSTIYKTRKWRAKLESSRLGVISWKATIADVTTPFPHMVLFENNGIQKIKRWQLSPHYLELPFLGTPRVYFGQPMRTCWLASYVISQQITMK